jgi:hypothetical protein
VRGADQVQPGRIAGVRPVGCAGRRSDVGAGKVSVGREVAWCILEAIIVTVEDR